MREEYVTLKICKYIKSQFGNVIAFDFPGGGRRTTLHMNYEFRVGKNFGIVVPDIVATIDGKLLFMENKVGYFEPDVNILCQLKFGEKYTDAINAIACKEGIAQSTPIFIGVGLENTSKNLEKIRPHFKDLDFVLFVDEVGKVTVAWDEFQLFAK